MAEVLPLRALHYDLDRTGGLQPVAAPPYDVIDEAGRAALADRSPYNVVAIDLPRDPGGGDPYAHAAATFAAWQRDGILVRDAEEALWPLEQEYTGPDGRRRTRRGFLARVRVEDYGAGRIRPHERTHPGPREDRLRLTRATAANLSPIFSLYDDPAGGAWGALAPHAHDEPPYGELRDDDGTVHRLWRVADPDAIAAVRAALEPAELLIADGHHRYETARIHARETDDPGAGYVLMCLVALQDPGLTVFPTHRLLTGLDDGRREALARVLERDFEAAPVAAEALEPTGDGPVRIGHLDRRGDARMLTLRDPAIAAAALPGHSEPYRELDTAVLEGVVLRGALGMSEEDISHLRGLAYARDASAARERVQAGEADAAFFMRATPIEQVRAVAAAGESMPPKSTFFYPKVPTGMLFNVLREHSCHS